MCIADGKNRVTVEDAARLLGVSKQFIRVGLQKGVIPIGTCVKLSSVYTYHISAGLLDQYLGKTASDAAERA